MASSASACIALGSNLGDRAANILAGLNGLGMIPGTRLEAASECIETDPVGPLPQPSYLNAAAIIRTQLPPRALLTQLLQIEQSLGRRRSEGERWGPRTLDLDLLLYDDLVLTEPGLTIPHPRLQERMFVLVPLAQIAPGRVIPTLGVSVQVLKDRLSSATAPLREAT